MKDINLVALAGRLTRDPELKYANSGVAILNFSIACNDRTKNGDVWEDEGHFFDCVIIGKLAEAISPRMVKGAKVFLNGRLKQNRWESKDGQKRSKVEVFVYDIDITGKQQVSDF